MKIRLLLLFVVSLGLAPVFVMETVRAEGSDPDPVAEFNRLWKQGLERRGVEANPVVDDATFMRRASLAISGRIPTLQEIQAFLEDTSADKRSRLVDSLTASPAASSHLFNWWADLLRVKTRLPAAASGEPYVFWLRDAVTRNVPYDRMVRDLLTSEGSIWEPGKGASGYYVRDLGMPQENAANTARIFLGTDIACAQCHDHPTDPWTRKQFMQLTAFTIGSFSRAKAKNYGKEIRRSLKGIELGQKEEKQLRRLARSASHGVFPRGGGFMRLPKDYQYDDARPGSLVRATVPFGEAVEVKKGDDPRRAYVDWMTSPSNPRFTTVIANRMFKRAFGTGLIEPVDDIKQDTRASDPELMAHLESVMKSVGYDLKAFTAVLCKTDLFQREKASTTFSGPTLQRLTAEQLWDSLVTLIVDDPEKLKAEPMHPLLVNWDKVKNLRGEELVRMARETSRGEEKLREIGQKLKELGKKIKRAKKSGDKDELRELYRQAATLRDERDAARDEQMSKVTGKAVRKLTKEEKRNLALMRASELQAPASPGHLLRQFGQSDREVIENGSDKGSVPQILTLMNGFIDQRLILPGARFARDAKAAEGLDAKIDTVYLNILCRHPSDKERQTARMMVVAEPKTALVDVAWVLLNSHEFLFPR